ncbi:MAG: AI-2E family transporter [Bdellovibrionia bacterium]
MILKTVSNAKNIQKTAIALLFIFAFVYITGPFLVSVALGAVIAIVAQPWVKKLVARGWGHRTASGALTALLALAAVLPTAGLLIVGLQSAFEELRALHLKGTSLGDFAYTPGFRKMIGAVTRALYLPQDSILEGARRMMGDVVGFLSKFFGDLLYQLPEFTVALVALILAIYYALADGPKIIGFLRANSPYPSASTSKVFTAVRDASYSVIVATFISAISQTVLMGAGIWLTATPNAALAVLFTFLFAFLPVFGTAPISIGVVAYHLATGHGTEAAIMLAVGIAVSLIDNVVHVVVLKNRSHIHPLIGFVAVFGGLKVLGFGGIFLGPVLAAITMELIPILIREQKKQNTSHTLKVAAQDS